MTIKSRFDPKIAIVYDRVNKWGGAERVLLALHKIWPEAPLYTAVYDKNKARWADVFHVHKSFLGNLPHEFLPWITPLAFETFNFDEFDVVLSVTSAEAKGIITKPHTRHICYCLTPTRYLWSSADIYESQGIMGYGLRMMSPMLRRWDKIAASRPDKYIAISQKVKQRIKMYYKKEADVIYPPVNINKFKPNGSGKFFLCVARLVPYKRVDIVIEAFNTLGWPLKIVGTGMMESTLRKMAKRNIEFIGDLTDQELVAYYQGCRAFVYGGEEDFGIVSVEAQACGKPVICRRESGMTETVVEGKTGEFFDKDLVGTLQTFVKKRYDSNFCRRNAERFSIDRFTTEMKETIRL